MADAIDLRRSNSSKVREKKPTVMLLNRALSLRSNRDNGASTSRHDFSLASLYSTVQPELSKKLYKMIKTENYLISSYEAAGRERLAVASQLSDWGESTKDDALNDIAGKIGALLSELGKQESLYAKNLESCRCILKTIRNTEKSVQPSRDSKSKILDEISKLKAREPESVRLITLEQELIRTEAENLVAEAQLTNITRKKLKQSYISEFAATIERAEKQIIIAQHGYRLLDLLDDSLVIPGVNRRAYEYTNQARQILNDAEDDLKDWKPDMEGHIFSDSHYDMNLDTDYLHRREQTADSGWTDNGSDVTGRNMEKNRSETLKTGKIDTKTTQCKAEKPKA